MKTKRIATQISLFSAAMVLGFGGGCSSNTEAESGNNGTGGQAGGSAGQGAGIGFDGSVGASGAPGAAGTGGGGLDGSLAEFCSGSGTVVTIGDKQTCTGQVASSIFKYALCSCSDLQVNGSLTTDGFDSSQPQDPAKNGAAVGVNKEFHVNGMSSVGGSLFVAGTPLLGLNGNHTIAGDFQTNSTTVFVSGGSVQVGRDAWVAGDILGGQAVTVARDLHQPAGKQGTSVNVGQKRVVGPVNVAAPCNCQQKLDIGALVASFKNNNDNATVGLDPDALANVVGDRQVTLDCGRFYVNSIGGAGKLVINVPKRVALFVGGDVFMSGQAQVNLGEQGEIDIFVAGDFIVNGDTKFGDPARPAGTRVYVDGSKAIGLNGTSAFVGNLFAPHAMVVSNVNLEVFGSIYANGFVGNNWVKIHYDKGILKAGDQCKVPPNKCNTCGDCGSEQACKGGACTTCSADADCCPPLICYQNGKCGPLVIPR